MLKPALCAAALALAVAIPAVAQQSQSDNPPAAGPAAPGPDGRPDWRGGPRGRYSDEDGSRWRRRDGERRFGRGEDEGGGWREHRFGERGMMGLGTRHFGMMARICGANGGRAGEMLIDRLERATQPTTEQRPNFDRLKEAANKAHEIMRGACPAERAVTPTGRLMNAEKRLAAMLEAVRTVRPAMDAYYGTLTDEQKARLTLAQSRIGRGGMGGWRERLNRWRERMHNNNQPRSDRTENAPPADSERL